MKKRIVIACVSLLLLAKLSVAQKTNLRISFMVSVKDAAAHVFHIEMLCEGIKKETSEFRLSEWTPGYYQLMNYAGNISGFTASTATGEALPWEKSAANAWKIPTANQSKVLLSYDVKAPRAFVAANYLDAERGYISPAGVFMYPSNGINTPVTVTVVPYTGWTVVATGLDAVKNHPYTYTATDYDVLYDSPFLMGKLESLPSFSVKNIPHYFVAYKPGDFDKTRLMSDLQKIVIAASDIIGHIPYKNYTFLAIGPGGGGIEHLNSASISFEGTRLYSSKESMVRVYNFLAHEYFHHYNVKRIRPIELGPFDYDKGSRTKMLWLSEGITVYYEYLIVKRAGFTNAEDVLTTFGNAIKAYENKPGRLFQTPADASYTTWEDGPFGRTGDEVNKTISPYDKGPALGILLDFKIRHETKNKKSLDNLMRGLYQKYYQEKKRGFTEAEFRTEAEKMAGTSLADFFDYIYTLKTVDYTSYLQYAGLHIDTSTHSLPGAWLGTTTRSRNDTLTLTNVDWQSPAWQAGLRSRQIITQVNGQPASEKVFRDLIAAAKENDLVTIQFTAAGVQREAQVRFGTKKEKQYIITPVSSPTSLQLSIYRSWLGEK